MAYVERPTRNTCPDEYPVKFHDNNFLRMIHCASHLLIQVLPPSHSNAQTRSKNQVANLLSHCSFELSVQCPDETDINIFIVLHLFLITVARRAKFRCSISASLFRYVCPPIK